MVPAAWSSADTRLRAIFLPPGSPGLFSVASPVLGCRSTLCLDPGCLSKRGHLLVCLHLIHGCEPGRARRATSAEPRWRNKVRISWGAELMSSSSVENVTWTQNKDVCSWNGRKPTWFSPDVRKQNFEINGNEQKFYNSPPRTRQECVLRARTHAHTQQGVNGLVYENMKHEEKACERMWKDCRKENNTITWQKSPEDEKLNFGWSDSCLLDIRAVCFRHKTVKSYFLSLM